ncbi:MAG: folylpolyglutamate synthase/dihydrofolate synthase family protein [Deltaproteobacteria bacterium]
MPSTDKILEYLGGLERHGIRPGLERIKRLLSALGDPQEAYPCVHIAGTNGKGSTSAFISSVLIEAGFRTGVYTSPHLIKFNERIRVGSRMISDADIGRLAASVKKAASIPDADGDEPTFFEFTTAMAFEYFREKKIDIAVIETGLGGRLDATNVITPVAGVITNIGIDHEEFLGSDIRSIAAEKAGIMKKGVAFFTAEDKTVPLSIMKAHAGKTKARLCVMGADFSASPLCGPKGRRATFDYTGTTLELKGCSLGLAGAHQIKNAACAIAAIEGLVAKGLRIPRSAIRAGLKKAVWPGRMETVSKNPLVVFDCAHNPDGAATLERALKDMRYKRLILVIGVMQDKDINRILERLVPLASTVIVTEPKTTRAEPAPALAVRIAPYKKEVVIKTDVRGALKEAVARAAKSDMVLVTGSIFTVGEAKRAIKGVLKRAGGL